MTKTFRDLGVDTAFCDALEATSIIHPFPIQELTLPLALDGQDLIGQARTGTGKTLAFGLPLLQRIDAGLPRTQALVVVPTRELCLQVYEDLQIGKTKGLTSISVYGGVPYEEQIEALTGGAHVVVGTPGRLLDHLQRGNLDLSQVTELVLDEADEMLDMGFLPDVERLIEACPIEGRHTMLFSATMPTAIVKLARRYMHHPTFTRADHEQRETAPNVTQHFFQVHRMDKPRLLARILQDRNRGGVYVFVRTKHMADRLVNELEELGVPAIAVHGDLRQSTRERNLDRFRDGSATVLVCTEVAARGLDVSGVTHVVNYDCPDDEKMYLHRIGRTARAGEAGVAITFAEFNEVDRLNVIRKKIDATDTQIEPVFSTSDVLAERFDLPDEVPWSHRARGSSRDTSRAQTRKGAERSGRDRDDAGTNGAGRGRRAKSSGRPRSERSSEGRGGEHDARREPAATPAGDESPKARARARGRGADAPAGDRAARTRTRTRTRTRDDAVDTADDAPSRQRERQHGGARDRSQRTRDDAEGGDHTTPAGDDGATGTDGDGGGSRQRGGAGRDPQKRARSSSGRQARKRSGSGGGTGRGGRGSGGRGSGNAKPRDDQGSEPASVPQGRPARGEGQPQLARRVRVDHLP